MTEDLIELVRGGDVKAPMCGEFKKMILGSNFAARNSECMLKYKLDVRRKLLKFNDESIGDDDTLDSLKERRMAAAKTLFGRVGVGTNIEAPFFCTWGCTTFIGKDVYINKDVSIFDSAPVQIGSRVLLGPGVSICTDTHDLDAQARIRSGMGSHAKPITIGDDCWIGGRVFILAGVTIGKGSTIAAGAVVTRDVAENTLVGGVPAKFIRKIDGSKALAPFQTFTTGFASHEDCETNRV
ncbi:hypothetical protein ACMFMG_008178 [Clarireedia jacksonii]